MSDAGNVDRRAEAEVLRISGFWRRIGAATIDGLLLGLVGAVLGFLWFDQLAALGQNGRFLGCAIAFAYLAILNSRIGSGQTLGKRLLKIRVTDVQGSTVSLERAALRSLILLVPGTLNGMSFADASGGFAIVAVQALCVFGLGGALAYLFCVNRQTRQSVHDLAARTIVVDAESAGGIELHIWKPHLAIALSLLCAAPIGAIVLSDLVGKGSEYQLLAELLPVTQAAVPGAQVQIRYMHAKQIVPGGGGLSGSVLYLDVVVFAKPDSPEALADRIAMAILRDRAQIQDAGRVRISISYGYDIMISRVRMTQTFAHSPADWLKRLSVTEPGAV